LKVGSRTASARKGSEERTDSRGDQVNDMSSVVGPRKLVVNVECEGSLLPRSTARRRRLSHQKVTFEVPVHHGQAAWDCSGTSNVDLGVTGRTGVLQRPHLPPALRQSSNSSVKASLIFLLTATGATGNAKPYFVQFISSFCLAACMIRPSLYLQQARE
jgi:hypothetical protein